MKMTQSRSIAALVLFNTDDARLFPETLDVSSPAKAAAVRQAVIDNLPQLSRVVLVISEEHARLMCAAHDMAARDAGLIIVRPPADYVPPARD